MKVQNILLLFIIIGLILVVLYQTFTAFIVVGDSMRPTFTGCTLVIVSKDFNPAELQKGQIVVVNMSGILNQTELDKFAHRVYENYVGWGCSCFAGR